MALHMLSWDLPSSEAQMNAYNEKARTDWIPTFLKQPGVKEFRGYRNPALTSPQVAVHMEFDSMHSLMQYLASDDYSNFMRDLRDSGSTNISAETWDGSPLVPKPLRPFRN